MSFSQITAAAARKPAAIVTLAPSAFADDWPHRPAKSVAVGLSLLSDRDIQTCRAEARKEADEMFPGARLGDDDWIESRNDALMRWAISLSLCDANDASQTYLHMQDEDRVKSAFTPQGVRHLWDELERATISQSPVRQQATDDDVEELGRLLIDGTVQRLVAGQSVRMRKLVTFMLDELAPLSDMLEETA